jgi:hypothetical protein
MNNLTSQERAAVGFLIGGILVGIFCVIADVMGAPSWLHAFTFVGGGAFGYGIVTLVNGNIERRQRPGLVRSEDERLS